jgi:hypothetical protein
MGELVDIRTGKSITDLTSSNSLESVLGQMQGSPADALVIINEYAELVRTAPLAAIEQLSLFIERVRAEPFRPEFQAYEGLAGGPAPELTGAILNCFGTIYPFLLKDHRKIALHQVFVFLNSLKDDHAKNQVEVINDPWLAGDIILNQGRYWPGCEDYCNAIRFSRNLRDFRRVNIEIKSKFLFALATLNISWSNSTLLFRRDLEWYFPDLVGRTLDYVAGSCHKSAKEHKKEGIPYEITLRRKLKDYDPSRHQEIREKILNPNWIILEC